MTPIDCWEFICRSLRFKAATPPVLRRCVSFFILHKHSFRSVKRSVRPLNPSIRRDSEGQTRSSVIKKHIGASTILLGCRNWNKNFLATSTNSQLLSQCGDLANLGDVENLNKIFPFSIHSVNDRSGGTWTHMTLCHWEDWWWDIRWIRSFRPKVVTAIVYIIHVKYSSYQFLFWLSQNVVLLQNCLSTYSPIFVMERVLNTFAIGHSPQNWQFIHR